MSVVIDNTEDLLALLKKLGLKITTVDELRDLLATINAHYNPEAARVKIAKLIGVTVPCVACGIAGGVSSFLMTYSSYVLGSNLVGALAVVWGVCGLVSMAALIFSFIMAGVRHGGRTGSDSPSPGRQPSCLEPLMTAITDQRP